jgi:hypothetical protein
MASSTLNSKTSYTFCTFIGYFQHFLFKFFAAAYFTGVNAHLARKLHFHHLFAFAFAGIAPASIYVK